MDLKNKLKQKAQECNEEARRDWRDDRIFKIESCRINEDDEVLLTISIGRWDTTFHDISSTIEDWKIVKQSENNVLLDDIMYYFIIPIING